MKTKSRQPLIIAGLYAISGVVWIYCSDRLLPLFAESPAALTTWSTVKGWLFIAATTLLLYLLIRRHTGKLLSVQEKLLGEQEQMKKAQAALSESEAQFRQMFTAHSAMLYLVDAETLSIVDANKSAQKFYGYTQAEFAALKLPELSMLPESRVRSIIEENTGIDACYYTITHYLSDGTPREVEIYSTPIRLKERRFFFNIVHDITERKHTEAALIASEENYRAIFEAVNDGIFIHDIETGRVIDINTKSCEMFGYSRKDFPRDTPELTSAPESRFSRGEAVSRMREAATGNPQLFEWKARHRNGSTFWLEINLKKVVISGMERLLAVVRDISARKAAEEALRESEARFRSLVESTTDWIWETDSLAVLTYSSPKVKSLLGFEPEEVVGLKPFDLATNEDRENITRLFNEAKACKNPFSQVESRFRKKDGSIVVLESSGVPIFDQNGNFAGFRGYERNITDRKHLEEQLLQAQKMEAVGQLAGGIAHDFNNILTAITGFVFILQMKLEDEELKNYVEQIRLSAERAAGLTDSLLAFSRKQIICLKSLNINEIILKTEKLLSRLIREDVEIRTDLCDEDLVILGDETKVEQIIINLATNARDAMPRGGILSIRTERCLVEQHQKTAQLAGKPAGYAHLSISDTGIGIDENVRERIFEPFFTTKEVGKGTGLGLSIVYGIVKQLNGYINIQSEARIGTSISIYLPLVQQEAEKAAFVQPPIPMEASGTLLVAEDDPDVRRFIKTVLEEFGYTIIEAEDGVDAVKKFKENSHIISMVIFDIIMPRKNGRDAFLEIRKLYPDVKAIFVSGYTGEFLTEEGILEEGLHFLPKPVVPWSLLEKVQE
ncbi:MAG TPA: PAS domain S-box protein, partial [Geobacteraceae bacterium]|nr:PAS domain S-box protein [Geobacteraceae bacterium]